MFIAIKTDDGRIKGKISFYCKVLHVSRQAFNKFLKTKDTPWKYQALADAMLDICSEDECKDTYGRIVSAKYCYAAHESRLHQNDRCKRFALCLVLTVRFRSLAPWGKLFQLFI